MMEPYAEGLSPARSTHRLSDLQIATGDASIGLQIALAGGLDDAGGQRRRRRFAVPAPGTTLRLEIIAQRLLVETWLRLAGLVPVSRPETRTVRCHHLVDQDDAAVFIPAKFELGVRDNDASIVADLFAYCINRTGHALEHVCHFLAKDLAHPRNGDVLVVAGFGLGRRAENWWIELAALQQAVGKLFTGQRAILGVFLPR